MPNVAEDLLVHLRRARDTIDRRYADHVHNGRGAHAK